MIDNFTEIIDNSRHNLMSRHVCPVGNITRLETLTPHGWAQLIALERRGLSVWNEETVDALYRCADCGSCRAHSVYDVALPEAISAARADIVKQNAAPPSVYEMERILGMWENPYEQRRPEPADGTGDTALFVGDDTYFLKPSVLEAALELLRSVGIDPVLIGKGRNTGYLASSLGLPGVAWDLAQANLEELKATGAQRLFVLSPGAFFAFNQMYGERLGLVLPAGVELLEVIPFLADQLKTGKLRLKQRSDPTVYAYVDPTHAVRVKARAEAPRALLAAVLPEPVRELFWRDGRAYPCGDLALEFTQPDIADALTRERLADAARTGAEGVITEGPGSLAHLERHAPAYDLRVRGLYELLAEQLAP